MASTTGKALAAGVVVAGGVYLWSALYNQNVTAVLQSLIKGQKPQPGPAQSPVVPLDQGQSTSPGGGTGPGGPPPPVSGSLTSAVTALLTYIGAPGTAANVSSMEAWYSHENSGWPPGCANNPWNTTLSEPGATDCNSVGVKNYPSLSIGVKANGDTITGGYPQITAALRAGTGVCGGGLAQEFLTWSGGGYSSVC
jgi:hypothetical protein